MEAIEFNYEDTEIEFKGIDEQGELIIKLSGYGDERYQCLCYEQVEILKEYLIRITEIRRINNREA